MSPAPAGVAAAVSTRQTRRTRLRGPALTLGGLVLATAALQVRDPHVSGSWGHCPLALVGIWCPGCGGLRAVNDLGRGDLAAAASSNLLVVLLVPAVLGLLAGWTYAAWSGRPVALPAGVRRGLAARPTWVTLAVLVVGFTLLRNLPVGSWLAP